MHRLKENIMPRMWLFNSLVILIVVFLAISWIVFTPPGLLGKADAIGYAVCHRIDARSFHIGDRQMPLCARCSGMFLGALIGLIYQASTRPHRAGMPHWSILVALFLLAASFAVDGLNSYVQLFPGAPSLYEPHNWSRLLTGSGMGLAVSGLLFPAFNQTVWREWYSTAAINNFGSLGIMVLITIILDLLILTENPFILYPVAMISTFSVVFLLTLVYTMVVLMVIRKENKFDHIRELIMPLIAGFGIALLQIIFLDLVRYFFTGTWDGFHLG
jgi:uncharacterized membrane protein